MKVHAATQIKEFHEIAEEGEPVISAAESLNSWSYAGRDIIDILRVHPLWVNGSGLGGMMYVVEYRYKK